MSNGATMTRWMIRSFFIGLLLLCVGGWIASYKYRWTIFSRDRNFWSMSCTCGRLHLAKYQPNWVFKDWGVYTSPADAELDSAFFAQSHGHYLLGFIMSTGPTWLWVAIPFWFLTTISAALLWWVWQKTRPKPRGFPVELASPIAEPSGKAE